MDFIDDNHVGLVIDAEAQELLSKAILETFMINNYDVDTLIKIRNVPVVGFDQVGTWEAEAKARLQLSMTPLGQEIRSLLQPQICAA